MLIGFPKVDRHGVLFISGAELICDSLVLLASTPAVSAVIFELPVPELRRNVWLR